MHYAASVQRLWELSSNYLSRDSRALGTLEHQSLVPNTNIGLPTINRTPEDSMPSSGLNGHPHTSTPNTRGNIIKSYKLSFLSCLS